MIVLFTDFGWRGPYVGQMHLVLADVAPGLPVVDLMHDVPAFDIRSGAHLLAALACGLPRPSTVVAVVDPGVGSSRPAVVLQADGRLYVGPGNGLFQVLAARAGQARWWELKWRPERMSATFHGRDLFAPVAGLLASGRRPLAELAVAVSPPQPCSPGDWARIIYFDAFGNAMSGLRGADTDSQTGLSVEGRLVPRAGTFSDVPPGVPFCFVNSLGLLEVAVNQGSAREVLGLSLGSRVQIGRQ